MAVRFVVVELTSIAAGAGQKSTVSEHVPATQSASDVQAASDAATAAAAGNPRRTVLRFDD